MNYEEQLYPIYVSEQEYLKRTLPFDEYLSCRGEVFRTKESIMYDPELSKIIELTRKLQRVVRLNKNDLAEEHLKTLIDYRKYYKFDDSSNKINGCYVRCSKLFLWFDNYLKEQSMEGIN